METRVTNPLFFKYCRTPRISEFKSGFEYYYIDSEMYIPDYKKITNQACAILESGSTMFTQCSIIKYYKVIEYVRETPIVYNYVDLLTFKMDKYNRYHKDKILKKVDADWFLYKPYTEIGKLVPSWCPTEDQKESWKWKPIHPNKHSYTIKKGIWNSAWGFKRKEYVAKALLEGRIKTINKEVHVFPKKYITIYDAKSRPLTMCKKDNLHNVWSNHITPVHGYTKEGKIISNLSKQDEYLQSLELDKKASASFWKTLKNNIKKKPMKQMGMNDLRKAWINNKIIGFTFNGLLVEIKPPVINDLGEYDISKSIYLNGEPYSSFSPESEEHAAWVEFGADCPFRPQLFRILSTRPNKVLEEDLERRLMRHFLYVRIPEPQETAWYRAIYQDPDTGKSKIEVIREFSEERARLKLAFMVGCFPPNILEIKLWRDGKKTD